MFVHFKPVDHDAMNDLDREAQRHPSTSTAAVREAGVKKVDSMGATMKNIFGSPSVAKKTAPTVANKKAHIGGHEQSNHDEDHVQKHLDRIDKEHHALADAGRMTLEKSAAQLDDQTAAIKAALLAANAKAAAEKDNEIIDPDSADRLPVKGPAVLKARLGDPVRPPAVQTRFNRRFASVDSSQSRESGDGPSEGEEAGAAGSEEGMADAANAIADMVEPGNQELVEALRDAAASGDHDALTQLLDDQHVHLIHSKDENDWNILHEAIRSGDLDSVKLLVDLGADIGAKVLSGGAALWIAKYYLEEDHPVTKYLRDIGAPEEEEL